MKNTAVRSKPTLNQKGYVALTLVIAFVLLLLLNFPVKFAEKKPTSLQLSTGPAGTVTITTNGCQVPTGIVPEFEDRKFAVDTSGEEDSDYKSLISSEIVTYKQVLRDVPVLTEYLNNEINIPGFDNKGIVIDFGADKIREIDGRKYYLLYPRGHGNIDISKGYEGKRLDFKPALNGMVFLAHTDSNLKPITIPGQTFGSDKGNFLLTDVYQVESMVQSNPIPEVAIRECQGLNWAPPKKAKDPAGINPANLPSPTAATPAAVIMPSQNSSVDKEQLQLEWFLFGSGQSYSTSVAGAWSVHCKPAIYLYPPQKELVNVKVFPSGFLTYVDPPYDFTSGWIVEADPNGSLFTMNHEPITNNYLYFESKIRDEVIQKPTQGWVRKYGELEQLYKDILPKLGLNERQTQDFIDYWKKSLPEAPYYFVGIIDQDNVNQIERLEITPKPDLINRVRVYFERLDSPKQVETPKLSKFGSWNLDLGTSTFKVVEWGGMIKNDLNHPFTCSQ